MRFPGFRLAGTSYSRWFGSFLLGLWMGVGGGWGQAAEIPLPEHPRPDFERADWLNLNGTWAFRFDREDEGIKGNWGGGTAEFLRHITVPFPWGSRLSGIEKSEADVGWYAREMTVPESWRGKRVFLVVGACDWRTQGWLDGQAVGEHQGGYTPFEFELTRHVRWGQGQKLVLRVDDTAHPFKLEGKQGYGQAKGIWQTVYLEARPAVHVRSIRFRPDVDRSAVGVDVEWSDALPAKAELALQFRSGGVTGPVIPLPNNAELRVTADMPLPGARLWSLEDPFLYEVDVELRTPTASDRVSTYFGMRKISVMNLPGTEYPYIALNDRPVYLQMTLDQSYHPDGFYTFPSDAFMREEILRSRRLGLNANRLHVKIDVPRKLYWADRLGLLLMCDVPNSWGEPEALMRAEIEQGLRGLIARDFNHPSIFSWVPFNETWGLFTKQEGDKRAYLPETQEWVAQMYRLARQLDPTRLVEDNSPCNYDHVETDINSWHAYLPGYAWRSHLDEVTTNTHPGSPWNFIGGRKQGRQPLLNSECGNVWGYEGSTGDVDWTWDYHIMMNEFRRHPKVCGWLYTEHHDVINEWNGYYRFDRSDKVTGLEELVPGMTLRDLHGACYIATGGELCRDVKPGETVKVPVYASLMTDAVPGGRLVLRTELVGWDQLGHQRIWNRGTASIPSAPWASVELPDLRVPMPGVAGLAILRLYLETPGGVVLHRNFTCFRVADGPAPRAEVVKTEAGTLQVIRWAPAEFKDAKWSQRQWNVLDGLKVNGAGHGFFEYRVAWPADLKAERVVGATFLMEASAKQLFGKDREGAARQEGDYMLGRGTLDPSLNPNAYPMTDTVTTPSAVRVRLNGVPAQLVDLPDDPADHRGILSWHAQLRDKKLREAGSYGYLVQVTVPAEAIAAASKAREWVIRLEVDAAMPGGLAIYGERFGRYPLDPTLLVQLD